MPSLELNKKAITSKLDGTDKKLIAELATAYTGSTSISELSNSIGIPVEKANVKIETLVSQGYVEKQENGEYKLSAKGRNQAHIRNNKPN